MPDKDFEQQLRDGLHDWQVTPPPPVRDAVLEAVRRRRRRRGLLWIPLGLLLLGAGLGGYYALREQPAMPRPNGPVAAGAAPVTTKAAPAPTGAAPAPTKTAPAPTGASPMTAISGPAAPGAAGATPGSPSATPGAGPAAPDANSPTPDAITLRKTVAEQSAASAATPAASATQNPAPAGTSAAPGEPAAQDKPDLVHSDAPGPLPATPWTPGKISHKPLVIAQTPITIGHAKSPWSFHIHASTGATGQGAFLSFGAPAQNKQVVFRDANNPVNNAYPSAGNTGTDTLTGRDARWGWSVGLSVARRLSDRFEVEAGLAFTQAETRIGPLNDHGGSYLGYTSAGQVYNIGGSGQYTRVNYVNDYRLLSLPVDVSWSVAPRTRVQPSVYLGVAPAYLFSGDALMYNPEYSGYEVSKTLYRHWQFSGELGLMGNLFRFRDGKRITIGPFLQYGFPSLQKPAPVQDHLNYAGIRLDLGLPGKKIKP